MSRPQCPNHSCNLNLVGVAFAHLLTTAALGMPLVAACSEKAEPASTTDDAPEPSGDPTDAPSEGTDTPAPSGPVEPTGKLLGGFDLKFDAMTTSFSGTVYKTPPNETITYQVLAEAGDCVVRKPQVFSCMPDCAGGEQCNTESTCVAEAVPASAGEITVSGITKKDMSTSFTLKPLNPTTQRYNVGSLAVPPFAPGDTVTITAPGEDLAAFTLEGHGITALDLGGATAVPFEVGKPSDVTWVAGDPELARITLTVDVGHHGGSTAEILCDVPDTGSHTIPAELVTALSNEGVAGFPMIYVERRSTTYANVAGGHVDLKIASYGTLDVSIPGVISCNNDTECPDGQFCKTPDLHCVDE